MNRQLRRMLALVGAALLLPAAAEAQQGGRVAGRIVDAATQQPVAEAQVFVIGSNRGDRTDAEGRYLIAGIPAGDVQLRVLRLGFEAQTKPATIVDGQESTVDFALVQRVAVLEGVVTTATGEEIRMRETGNSVANLQVDTINLAPVQTFSQLVTGRAAGVSILQSGGTTGTGARVRIRGANSVSLSNEPLLIIDGVRVNNDPESSSIAVGGQAPSRLNDLNPEDIESIEILKGPAATGLYGTQAANGVVQVTTKRGRAGATRWNTWIEGGSVVEPHDYPPNYGGLSSIFYDVDENGNRVGIADQFDEPVIGCDLISQSFNVCDQEGFTSFNPLEVHSPFRTGYRQQLGLSVAGGSNQTTYYLSGEKEDEGGVYRTSNLDRVNLRANLQTELHERLRVDVAAGFLNSDVRLPQNDNNFFGYISNGIAGKAYDDDQQGYDPIGPEVIDEFRTGQLTKRFTGSATARWTPLDWLQVNGTAGADIVNRHDSDFFPPDIYEGFNLGVGYRQSNRFDVSTYTTNASAIGTFPFTQDLLGTTTIGFQYQRELGQSTQGYGEGIAPGLGGDLGGTTGGFFLDETYVDNVTAGALVQQQLAWRDRLFVTAALRGDDNSAFGDRVGVIYYPSANVSWVISEEPFFPQTNWLSSLRVRSAYGESGLRPNFRDAVTYYSPISVRVRGESVPGIELGDLGDPRLKPERTREYEAGFDLSVLDERVRFEATYYDKQSEDALINRTLPPSAGLSANRYENIGAVKNTGLETLVGATLLDLDPVQWSATLSMAWNKNELVTLGVPEIISGVQRFVEGYPLGGYWDYPLLGYDDANGDGLISADEVQVGDEVQYLGSSMPTRQASLSSDVTFLTHFRLSGLLDYRGGFLQENATEEFRCQIGTCRGVVDPDAPLEEQARAFAAALGTSFDGMIERADFVKLREIALTATAPSSLAGRFGVSRLSLTLAGRNLATWTDYTGLDPEVNSAGQDNFNQYDFLSQPQVRYYTARIDVTF
jgi:TonB-linked SusC/RagA family outer membrane protein